METAHGWSTLVVVAFFDYESQGKRRRRRCCSPVGTTTTTRGWQLCHLSHPLYVWRNIDMVFQSELYPLLSSRLYCIMAFETTESRQETMSMLSTILCGTCYCRLILIVTQSPNNNTKINSPGLINKNENSPFNIDRLHLYYLCHSPRTYFTMVLYEAT
jgi:hypothetical protein